MSVGRLRGVSSEEVDGRAERYRHVRPELLEPLTDYIATHGLHGLTMRNLAAPGGRCGRQSSDVSAPTSPAVRPCWRRCPSTCVVVWSMPRRPRCPRVDR